MAKVGFVSLGCPKALVDSELIVTRLRAEGYEVAKDYKDANLVVVNTCGFIDSAVEGAVANELDHPIEQDIRENRQARFMEVAQTVSINKLKNKVGKRIRVLVDSISSQGGVGRSAGDAPEIDGLVYILPPTKPSKRYRAGDFIKGTVLESRGHDLIVEV